MGEGNQGGLGTVGKLNLLATISIEVASSMEGGAIEACVELHKTRHANGNHPDLRKSG